MSFCIQFKSLLIINIFFVCPYLKVPVSVNKCFLVFFFFQPGKPYILGWTRTETCYQQKAEACI